MTVISYDLHGAPDFVTSRGVYLVRPASCEVKWFSGAIGTIEVTGNVVSGTTEAGAVRPVGASPHGASRPRHTRP